MKRVETEHRGQHHHGLGPPGANATSASAKPTPASLEARPAKAAATIMLRA